MVKLKTNNKIIEFGEWKFVDNKYWLLEDVSLPESDWARQFGHNNAVGFLTHKGENHYTIPRFFGADVKFLIEEWNTFNTPLPSNIDAAKKTIDNFLQLINSR